MLYNFHNKQGEVFRVNRIRELRLKSGWTQEYLAKRLNVIRQAVGHYMTTTYIYICDHCGAMLETGKYMGR